MGYTAKSLKPEQPYFAAWQDYRRRCMISWLVFLGLLPGTALGWLLVSPLCRLLDSEWPLIVLPVAGLSIVTSVYFWRVDWRCPKCAQRFCWADLLHDPFTDECLHCRLPKYAPCDPGEQQWEYIRLYEHPKPGLWQRIRSVFKPKSRRSRDAEIDRLNQLP